MDAVFGAKIFFKNFGIFGEYKYNFYKNDSDRLSVGVSFAFGKPYIPPPPEPPAPAPAPKPQFVYHPTITPEELKKVELLYQSTVRDIERQGRRLTIYSYSERNTFIQKYQGYPDVNSVNNVKYTSLPYYYYNKTSEKEIVAMAKKEPNEFMKVRMIHDWVADIFAYDHDYLEWMAYSNRNREYTLGQIIERERGVCLEYAILFHNLATAAGIDTYMISDHSAPNIGHAYNMVIVDGTGYIIDTTWDSGNQVMYNRYTANKKMFKKDYFMPSIPQSYKLRGW
ncbi:hypothetical protein FACS1894190_17580 [Spirochaetia bacterium]|nr:hypothetical protein FACS1894190_17580 [Spirochaetia bacterium]